MLCYKAAKAAASAVKNSNWAKGSDAGTSSQTTETAKKNSNRPKESRFLQQELPACKPLLTPKWVMSIFMLVGVIFIPIGVISLQASKSVVEIVYRYDDSCLPPNTTLTTDKVRFIQDATQNKTCIGQINVTKYMKQPIYVYYELDNYYQNHRRYVSSKSDTQILNNSTDTSSCTTERYRQNNESLPILPCGLIAWSLFNDTYDFTATGISVNKTGISWKSDREHKFGKVTPKNFPNNYGNESSPDQIGGAKLNESKNLNEDEDLMVWMRLAALPYFRKLYGRIEKDLSENTILKVNITNAYNTYSFGGKKKLVLSTTSWLGGKDDFLGIVCITMGSISIFTALLFLAAHLQHPRSLGDLNYLSWNK